MVYDNRWLRGDFAQAQTQQESGLNLSIPQPTAVFPLDAKERNVATGSENGCKSQLDARARPSKCWTIWRSGTKGTAMPALLSGERRSALHQLRALSQKNSRAHLAE